MALYEIFPELSLLLCVFHIVKRVWRWLFDKKPEVLVSVRSCVAFGR